MRVNVFEVEAVETETDTVEEVTLVKIIDREIFIAEQIERKVKERFTEGT